MKLYDLGSLSGYDSMTIFHAMAYEGLEGFVVVSPREPIVSLGYFQRTETSVDTDFCRENKVMLMRREVGGGTTLLDSSQIFYQIVFNKDNPGFPMDTLELYRKISRPVIDTYAGLGIKVKFKEVNDLVTVDGNRKISGEGGADIGNMNVFVGGILLDFDFEMMSRVFPVKSEEHRIQLLESLKSNLTTVKQEIGYIPSRNEVVKKLAANYEMMLGPLEAAELPPFILEKARMLEKRYTSEEFLRKDVKNEKGIKIACGVNVFENVHKAIGGRIFSSFEVKNGVLDRVKIYGDFTFLPREKLHWLEEALIGLPIDKDVLDSTLKTFISENNIDCPGLTPEDFTLAITTA